MAAHLSHESGNRKPTRHLVVVSCLIHFCCYMPAQSFSVSGSTALSAYSSAAWLWESPGCNLTDSMYQLCGGALSVEGGYFRGLIGARRHLGYGVTELNHNYSWAIWASDPVTCLRSVYTVRHVAIQSIIMDWMTFEGTGFENRVSGGVYTSFNPFAMVAAIIRSPAAIVYRT
jgi:hypothetical protein